MRKIKRKIKKKFFWFFILVLYYKVLILSTGDFLDAFITGEMVEANEINNVIASNISTFNACGALKLNT